MDTQERLKEENQTAKDRAEKEAAKKRAKKAADDYRKRYFDFYDDVKHHGDGILKNIEW